MSFRFFHRGHTSSSEYSPPLGPPPQTIFAPPTGRPPTITNYPSLHEPPHPPRETDPPPEWTASVGVVHEFGLLSDATEEEFTAGERFCNDPQNAVFPYSIIPSNQIDEIRQQRARAWCIDSELPLIPDESFPNLTLQRWVGSISRSGDTSTVVTSFPCKSVCLLSNLPLMGYYYSPSERLGGVYYEVEVVRMASVISIGTACKPYPSWRHPGWNRLSYALHLDDYRTFDGPEGGSDYEPLFSSGWQREDCTFGCGFDFKDRSIFFTYNGKRFPNAYQGLYRGVYKTESTLDTDLEFSSEGRYDVYAAIGVEGESEFRVNFGGKQFMWTEGNRPHWKVESLFLGDELPPYSETPSGSELDWP